MENGFVSGSGVFRHLPLFFHPALDQEFGEFGNYFPGNLAHNPLGHMLDHPTRDCIDVLV